MKEPEYKLASDAKPHEGSYYIPGEVKGAIPNGTRIVKCVQQSADSTMLGSTGTIISSIEVPPEAGEEGLALGKAPVIVKCLYFVEWDWLPGKAVVIADFKIKQLEN